LNFTDNGWLILFAIFVLLASGPAWPGAADVTEIAGMDLRGLGIAVYFISANFAAYPIGSNLIGSLNDCSRDTTDPAKLRYALLDRPAPCLFSSVCVCAGSRSMNQIALRQGNI